MGCKHYQLILKTHPPKKKKWGGGGGGIKREKKMVCSIKLTYIHVDYVHNPLNKVRLMNPP